MNTPKLSLPDRLRLAALRGIVKLLARAIAPALSPVVAKVSAATRQAHAARDGQTIDGEFRRIDPRHNSW